MTQHKQDAQISIHAPAKGATHRKMQDAVSKLFQSTLPRRERLHEGGGVPFTEHFNPRSREGSDADTSRTSSQRHRFQSTLPRRERQQKSPRLSLMIFAK